MAGLVTDKDILYSPRRPTLGMKSQCKGWNRQNGLLPGMITSLSSPAAFSICQWREHFHPGFRLHNIGRSSTARGGSLCASEDRGLTIRSGDGKRGSELMKHHEGAYGFQPASSGGPQRADTAWAGLFSIKLGKILRRGDLYAVS